MQQRMIEIINRLNSCQERAEKASFDTINQHDKVMNLVAQLVMDLDNMMTKVEAMNYELEDTVETLIKDNMEAGETLDRFSEMLGEQNGMIIEISQLLQMVMEEQQIESEVIHEMEAQIASNRETLEEILLDNQ